MNCGEVRDKLSEYLDGDLTPLERRELESHIHSCPSCSWELSTIKRTVQMLNSLPRFSAPPQVAQGVRRELAIGRLILAKRLFALATAAAVILMIFVVLFPALREGERERFAPSVEKIAQEKEALPEIRAEKSAAPEMALKEPQKALSEELLNKEAVSEAQKQEMKLTRAEAARNLAKPGESFSSEGGRLRKSQVSPAGGGQPTQSPDKVAQPGLSAAKVVEKEIVLSTSDLERDISKIASLFAEVLPRDTASKQEIDRKAGERGTVMLVFVCATEEQYHQLVDKIGSLGAVPDTDVRAKHTGVAGACKPEAPDKDMESGKGAKVAEEEKAKSGSPELQAAKSPTPPGAGEKKEEKQVEQSSGEAHKRVSEPREERFAGAGAPEVEKAISKPQKQGEAAVETQAEEKKSAAVRYIVRVKLVVVDAKK